MNENQRLAAWFGSACLLLPAALILQSKFPESKVVYYASFAGLLFYSGAFLKWVFSTKSSDASN